MNKYLAIILITLCQLTSCVEPFEISTNDSPPVIVIYGYLTDELSHHEIRISASSPYFDTQLNPSVSGADVRITASDNEIIQFKETGIPGLYLTTEKVAGTHGVTYSLQVEVDFDSDGIKETYTASSTMSFPVKVDSVELKNTVLMGYQFYTLYLYAQDPPSEDYYLGRYKINDSIILSNINQLSPMQDVAFNGQYINGMTIERFRHISEKDRIENEDRDDDTNEYQRIYLSPGDTITFSLCRIETGYYDFITQCRKEMRGENPFFGGPASNIVSNITNGGVGYFTTYALSTVETVAQ
jgi:hypothetical protein